MFHFKRRTLWIIIYITIPLILLLDSLGPDEDETSNVVELTENTQLQWALPALKPNCERHCRLVLDGSGWLRLTAILSQYPAGAKTVPVGVDLAYSERAGQPLVTLSFPAQADIEQQVLPFLRDWLPRSANPRWVMSGEDRPELWAQVLDLTGETIGIGRDLVQSPPSALTVLPSPPLGTERQLAFLLWIEILKQRLAGYKVQVTWDHRRPQSVVLLNTTLSRDLLYPVSEQEFAPVLQAYLNSAERTERNAEQIHRYLQTAVLYDIPFEFFTRQRERLQQITLDNINLSREQTLAEITKTK